MTDRARRGWPFLAAWIVGLAALAWSGTRVDGYRVHVLDEPLPHPYPWSGVLWFSVMTTVELAILLAIIRPGSYRRSWGRALAAVALGMPYLLGGGLLLMHAPPYTVMHWLWLAAVMLGMIVLLVVSVVSALRAGVRHTTGKRA